MTATAQDRGHTIEHDGQDWVDPTTRQPLGHQPCAKCGKHCTPEGYDACLAGTLDMVNSLTGVRTLESCCGHGTHPTWIWCECQNDRAVLRLITECCGDAAKRAGLFFDRLTVEYNSTHDKLVYVLERDVANMALTNSNANVLLTRTERQN